MAVVVEGGSGSAEFRFGFIYINATRSVHVIEKRADHDKHSESAQPHPEPIKASSDIPPFLIQRPVVTTLPTQLTLPLFSTNTMSGRGKGGKVRQWLLFKFLFSNLFLQGLGKGGAKRHRKILRDNIQGKLSF